MTKRNSTKRTLLLSVMALVLCFTMLVGTTYAWFTDSVTSGANKIVAGNLDVELTYKDGDTFKTVEGTTDLFSDVTLWEPGAYCYEVFKVANVGSLALKYRLSTILDTTDELLPLGYNTVIDEQDNDTGVSLLDVLRVKVIDGDANLTARPNQSSKRQNGNGCIRYHHHHGHVHFQEFDNRSQWLHRYC